MLQVPPSKFLYCWKVHPKQRLLRGKIMSCLQEKCTEFMLVPGKSTCDENAAKVRHKYSLPTVYYQSSRHIQLHILLCNSCRHTHYTKQSLKPTNDPEKHTLSVVTQLLNAQVKPGPQVKLALFTPALQSKKSLSAAPRYSTFSPHPTVTSHTAACGLIVPSSLSMLLSPPCTTGAHPTANLSSHQAWPPGF